MDCHKYSYYVCIIPDRNKKAFYELFAGKDLFGFILIRRWGRLGTKGQPGKKQRFLEEMEMLKEYGRVHQERIKRGYLQVNQTFHEIMNQVVEPLVLRDSRTIRKKFTDRQSYDDPSQNGCQVQGW